MLAVYLVSRFMVPLHAVTILVFIVLGGFLASLNHTRFDISAPLFECVYQVKYHDIHHWYPESNYGQYIMLWDHVFRSFKPYPAMDSRKAL
jgi:sterol desaturase/sphingolipid hydroxylase (fatty acid hydroxylase superfamily)